MRIDAGKMSFRELADAIKNSSDKESVVDGCIGQRYIATAEKAGRS